MLRIVFSIGLLIGISSAAQAGGSQATMGHQIR